MGLPIVYLKGSHIEFIKFLYISVPDRCFDLIKQCNSADPNEMQQYATFHLGLQCLPKYPLRGFQYKKGPLFQVINLNGNLTKLRGYCFQKLLLV